MARAIRLLRALFFLGSLAPVIQAVAQETVRPAPGSSPISNGQNHQPRQDQLDALHESDVTAKESQEIDRLYQQLEQNGKQLKPTRKGR